MECAESCGKSVTSEQEEVKPECEEGEVMMMQEQEPGAGAGRSARPPGTWCAASATPATPRSAAAPAPTGRRGRRRQRCPAPTGRSAASATWCTTRPADHQRACRCAPCSCPEPGCAFVGSRAMLLGHFAAGHQRPAVTVRYGRAWNLGFSLAHRWHVLVGDEDRSLFLVSLGPLGAATAVSLLCVRPDGGGGAAPRFRCRLSVERPAGDDKDNLVLMASAVSSSALSTGAPAPGQGMFLAVPHELISGDTLTLSLRIDLIQPAAAGGAPKSATPQARTPRRMQ
uniref:SIAH-type domain-containing protein n=1 Tax=Aegilops tauschii TaxID=37682 RepID=M8BMY3_AEGTA